MFVTTMTATMRMIARIRRPLSISLFFQRPRRRGRVGLIEWNGIVSAPSPWMATRETSKREDTTSGGTVGLDGLKCVL